MGLRVFNFRHVLVSLSGCGSSVYVCEIHFKLESLPHDKYGIDLVLVRALDTEKCIRDENKLRILEKWSLFE